MRFEFEMEILDLVDRFCLQDGQSIDKVLGRDQDAVEKQRVPGRQPQIAHRNIWRQCAGAHDDRQHVVVAGDEPPGIAAPADPLDCLCLTRDRHHHVADGKVLDPDLALFRQDGRPATVTGRVMMMVVMMMVAMVVIMIVVLRPSSAFRIIAGVASTVVLSPLIVVC